MNVKTIKILCGMLLMLAFTACSSDNDERADAPRFYNVTLTASMGDAETRALSEGTGNVITATFAKNDEVVVVKANGTSVGTLRAESGGTSTTTLSGTISGTFTENEVLTLRYRSATANYDGQLGTLAGIAANQDYAEGTLTVSTTSPSLTFESNSVTLTAKQSITKFTFKDASTDAAVSVKTFGIAAVGLVQNIAANGTETAGAVTGTLGTAASDVYIALRNNSDIKQTYAFTVKDNAGNWYTATKNAKLTNAKNYTATVKLNKLPALTSGSAVGTIGVVGGLPAIVIVNNNTTKTAVALMNTGALCPEAYGTYYTFANLPSGDWYVPSKAELETLAGFSSSWGAPYGVNGRTFTIGSNSLFLPAAGLDDTDNDPSDFYNVSTFGYYWSSDDPGEGLPICLSFSSEVVNIISGYKTDALPVRPFHALN